MRICIAEAARMATAHSAARRMSIRVLMVVSIMVGRSFHDPHDDTARP